MRHWLTTRLLLTAILAAGALYAEIPGKISYQGRLTDNAGLAINGQHSLTFKIFADSTGLGQVWTETQNGVVVTNGLFSVILGSATPIPLNAFEGQTCYLAIAIDGGIQLSPFHPMVSTPYAFRADIAGRASLGGGWSDGANVWLENFDKKVGIGTMTPSYKLDVVGTARASDSLIGSKLRLGSPSDDGRLNLYGNQTTGPAVTLREFSNGGGALELFHSDGSTINYLAADGDGSGGYMSMRRSMLDYGLIMDGNYSGSNNPRISILGADRSVAGPEQPLPRAAGERGRTVAEVWKQRTELKDAQVAVRGRVVKFMPAIMVKNWLHLRDGSGSSATGDDDITVTTAAALAVGDVVVVTGTVRVDRDFGSGYSYPVLIEDATVAR